MPFVAALVLALPLAFPMVAVAWSDDETKPQEPAGDTAPVESAASTGDPDLEALPEAMRPAAMQMATVLQAQLKAAKDPAKVQAALAVLDAQIAMAPDEQKPMLEFVRKKLAAGIAAMVKDGAGETAEASPSAPDAGEPKPIEKVEDLPPPSPASVEAMEAFVHACLIARPDLASGAADVMLADGVPATELALIVDQRNMGDRLERAVAATRADDALHASALKVLRKVDAGRDAMARDQGRLRALVPHFKGTLRQQADAQRRFALAGSYGVPVLVETLIFSKDPQLEMMAHRALVSVGRNAVLPLAAALPLVNESEQVRICQVLGEIGWKVAAPALVTLVENPKSYPGAREAARVVLQRMGVASSDAGALWAGLARECLVGGEGLVPHPADDHQLAWSFEPHGGMKPEIIPTAAYLNIMAKRFALRAMQLNPADGGALATFLAAGLRLEAAGLPVDGFTPSSLTLVAGPAVAREVLSLGLALQDAGLQRSAIQALAHCGGSEALLHGGDSPILACLESSSQRVRVDAALALARAMPTASFRNSDAVVPVLAGAVRSGGRPSAVVVSPQAEDRSNYGKWLADRGFEVVAAESDAAALVSAMAGRGSAELVVVSGSTSLVNDSVRALRAQPVTGASLMLLAVDQADLPRVDASLRDDRANMLWGAGRPAETFAASVDQLMRRSGGGVMGPSDGAMMVQDCAAALVDIGRAGGGVFRMADAEQALVKALQAEGLSAEAQPRIVEALSWVPTADAQRALITFGLQRMSKDDASGAALMLQAAASSARRFGDKADPGQVELVRKSLTAAAAKGATMSPELVAALSELHGSLNLGPEQAIKMIAK